MRLDQQGKKAEEELTRIEEESTSAAVQFRVVLTTAGRHGEQTRVGALLRQSVPPVHVFSGHPAIGERSGAVVEPMASLGVG